MIIFYGNLFIRLKEQLIKSVYASTKDVKETNEQYEQHIKTLEKVSIPKENSNENFLISYLGSRQS
jgi:hypothetical protein